MSAEPLFCVAWRRIRGADEVEGRTRRPTIRHIAEKIAEAANRQFPETHHWIEEVPADDAH